MGNAITEATEQDWFYSQFPIFWLEEMQSSEPIIKQISPPPPPQAIHDCLPKFLNLKQRAGCLSFVRRCMNKDDAYVCKDQIVYLQSTYIYVTNLFYPTSHCCKIIM